MRTSSRSPVSRFSRTIGWKVYGAHSSSSRSQAGMGRGPRSVRRSSVCPIDGHNGHTSISPPCARNRYLVWLPHASRLERLHCDLPSACHSDGLLDSAPDFGIPSGGDPSLYDVPRPRCAGLPIWPSLKSCILLRCFNHHSGDRNGIRDCRANTRASAH